MRTAGIKGAMQPPPLHTYVFPRFGNMPDHVSGISGFKLNNALSLNVKILTVFGYWPLETQQNSRSILYNWYSVTMVCLLTLYVIQEGVSLALIVGDLDKMITGSFVLLTHCAELVKIFTTFRRSDRIHKLLGDLKRPIFQPRNEHQYEMSSKTLKTTKNIYVSYLFVGVFTSIMLCLNVDKSDPTKRSLPFASFFPFDTQQRYSFSKTKDIYTSLTKEKSNSFFKSFLYF